MFVRRTNRNKIVLAMKITAMFLLAACLTAAATSKGQQVSLSLKNANLEKVFNEIEKQTGYNFIYVKEQLQRSNLVTIDVSNEKLSTVLSFIFKEQPLTYVISGEFVVIKSKEVAAPKIKDPEDSLLNSTIDVKGKIVNENGDPVIASVMVKGTGRGVTSNELGEFELTGIDENAVLQISGVSIEAFEVKVNKRSNLFLTAKTKVEGLQEVIVRKGYYDEKKRLSTGSVSTISAKDIEKQPVNNPLLALQGRVSGVIINQSNGLPGSGVTLLIRGKNSIANGNNPLYVIDGVPYPATNLSSSGFLLGRSGDNGMHAVGSGNPFSYINPNDIETIDILKDADATAIYGSRGANGVVLITTKKGRQGRLKLEASLQSGIGQVAKKLKLLNTRQYLEMRREAFKNDGAVPDPNIDYDLLQWDTARYTDWQRKLIGGKARYHNMQLAITGGNSNAQYRFATTYSKETTVFPADFNDQKISVQFHTNAATQNKKFNILISGVYTKDNNQLNSSDLTSLAVSLAPNAPKMYNDDGSINWEPSSTGIGTWSQSNNPAAVMNERFNSKTDNLISNAVLSYKPVKNVEVKTSFGYNNLRNNSIIKRPLSAIDPYLWAVTPRFSRFAHSQLETWTAEPQFTYNTAISKGTVAFLVGSSFQQTKTERQTIFAQGFSSDQVMGNIGSASTLLSVPTTDGIHKYNAVFARLNYNWQDEYIINLTARRDGSSRFGPKNRFHTFGAVGLGWVFSKNSALQKLFPFVSFGKLRLSYGTTGSDQVGDFSYMDVYSTYPVGVPYQGVQGIQPTRIFTPDLGWEETHKLELGLETGMFSDRLNIALSYYRNRSSNQLLDYVLPAITGFTSVSKNFDALVQNSGLELELNTVNVSNKTFKWSTALNISANRNKVISVSNGVSQYYAQRVGYPLSTNFYYKYANVDIVTGYYQMMGADGTPTQQPKPEDNKTPIDFMPKFVGGLLNSWTWKNFQLDVHLQFVYDVMRQAYISNLPGHFNTSGGSNQPIAVLGRWQKPGDVATIQRFTRNYNSFNIPYFYALESDRFYSDASYLRLKNVSISWLLPERWRQKVDLQNLKVFINGQNLYTLTNYQGLDPETGTSFSLPPLRVITFGLQTSF
jgi:TonB-dependent starch-binding outer membrane protein SusC